MNNSSWPKVRIWQKRKAPEALESNLSPNPKKLRPTLASDIHKLTEENRGQLSAPYETPTEGILYHIPVRAKRRS